MPLCSPEGYSPFIVISLTARISDGYNFPSVTLNELTTYLIYAFHLGLENYCYFPPHLHMYVCVHTYVRMYLRVHTHTH